MTYYAHPTGMISLLYLVIVLTLIGVGLWFFNSRVTAIDPAIKTIINVVVVLAIILWLLRAFGMWGGVPYAFH